VALPVALPDARVASTKRRKDGGSTRAGSPECDWGRSSAPR